MTVRLCAVSSCGRQAAAFGLCTLHDRRAKAGKPLSPAHESVGRAQLHGFYGQVSRGPDWVQCDECGRRFRMLVQHLRQAHGMTVGEYRDAHGLAAGVPLTCEETSRAISATAVAQMGTPEWERFRVASDRARPEALALASAAPRRAGAAQVYADLLRAARPLLPARLCSVCGDPVTDRSRSTCSQECWLETKRAAVRRREERRRRRDEA